MTLAPEQRQDTPTVEEPKAPEPQVRTETFKPTLPTVAEKRVRARKSMSLGKRIGYGAAIGVGLIGAGVGVGVGALVTGTPGAAPTDPNDGDPVVEGPVVPGPEGEGSGTETAPMIYSAEDLRLSAELTPEEAPGELVAILDKWGMAGATEETIDKKSELAPSLTWSEYATFVAEQNGAAFAEALYGQGWESDGVNDDGQRTFVNARIANNAAILNDWLREETFKYTSSLESSTLGISSDGTIAFSANIVETNNAEGTIVAEYSPELVDLNGTSYTVNVSLTKATDGYLLDVFSIQG